MDKLKSLLEQRIENDPELMKLFTETVTRFQKAAESERKYSEEAELISAEDLAVVVNVRAESDLTGVS